MAKGVVYLMTSAVRGLVKIGKTETANFEGRMRNLENNGYFNVAGLKRLFAIEVDDYSEKERMLHQIFEKARLDSSELFAINQDLAMELLSAFEGKVIYPQTRTKDEIFDDAAKAVEIEAETRAKKITRARSGLITDSEGRTVEATALAGKTGALTIYAKELMGNEDYRAKLISFAKETPSKLLCSQPEAGREHLYLELEPNLWLHINHSRTGAVKAVESLALILGISANLKDCGPLSAGDSTAHGISQGAKD